MRARLMAFLALIAAVSAGPVLAQDERLAPAPAESTESTGGPAAAEAAAPNPFEDWTGFFIAGDWRAHSGAPSEVFDNGRRDMAKAFADLGIPEENIAQFSVRPGRYPETGPKASLPGPILEEMTRLTSETAGGCLFFFTSHGAPQGIIMGELGIVPEDLAALVDRTCGDRPTVAMISACFSGIFVPVLEGPNRLVMTAARNDRTSFGCGEDDYYTFFDQCILQSLPEVSAFDALAEEARECVAERETELMVGPPSEPQVSIGAQIRPLLPLLTLEPRRSPDS